mgnify:CR=1 FL=1
MATIHRIYTEDFKKLNKDGKLSLVISVISLIISLITLWR